MTKKNKNGFNGHYHEKEYIEKQRKSHLDKIGKNSPNYKTGEFCGGYKKKGWNPKSIGRPFKKGQIMNPNVLNQEKERNPNWNGGTSFEPYTPDFNNNFRELIKERDHYACMLCNIFDDDAKILYKKRLAVHHIDSDKANTFPQNCCLLCLRCNNLVTKHREIWEKHFHELLKKLYNYEYTEDQKIILDFTR